MDNIKKIKHLYSRAAFGLCLEDAKLAGALTVKQAVDDLFLRSQLNNPLDIVAGNINFKDFLEKFYMNLVSAFNKTTATAPIMAGPIILCWLAAS